MAATTLPSLPTINRSLNQPVWQGSPTPAHPHYSEHTDKYVRFPLPPMPDLRPKMSAILAATDPMGLNSGLVSEHRHKYGTLEPATQRHCRRRDMISLGNGPIQSESSYSKDFALSTEVRRNPPSQPPPATIELTDGHAQVDASIYRSDFHRHSRSVLDNAPQPPSPLRALPSPAPWNKPFNTGQTLKSGPTEYSGNYHLWDTVRQPGIAPVYRKPKEPFIAESSYKTTFTAHNVPPVKPINPAESVLKMAGKFDGRSLYKDSFVPKPLERSAIHVYTNNDSVMYTCGPKDWWAHVPTDQFLENKSQIFYQAPR